MLDCVARTSYYIGGSKLANAMYAPVGILWSRLLLFLKCLPRSYIPSLSRPGARAVVSIDRSTAVHEKAVCGHGCRLVL